MCSLRRSPRCSTFCERSGTRATLGKAGEGGASMAEYLEILGFPEWQKLEDIYLGSKS